MPEEQLGVDRGLTVWMRRLRACMVKVAGSRVFFCLRTTFLRGATVVREHLLTVPAWMYLFELVEDDCSPTYSGFSDKKVRGQMFEVRARIEVAFCGEKVSDRRDNYPIVSFNAIHALQSFSLY